MAAMTAGEIVYKITGDSSGLNKNIKDADQNVSKLSASMAKLGTVVAGAFGVGAIITMGKTLLNLGSAAQETAQKFGVVYSSISKSANDAAKALAAGYNLSITGAKDLLGSTGNILQSLGYTQEAALATSVTLAQLGSDITSFSNFQGGAEEATRILTKAMLGERDALQSLDIKVAEADLIAYAKAQNKVWEALGQREKAELTVALLLERTKLAQGDVARSTESYAYNVRRLEANLTDLGTALGAQFMADSSTLLKLLVSLTSNTELLSDAFRMATPNIIDFLIPLNAVLKPMEEAINTFDAYISKYIDQIAWIKKLDDSVRSFTSSLGINRKATPAAPSAPKPSAIPRAAPLAPSTGTSGAGKPAANKFSLFTETDVQEMQRAAELMDASFKKIQAGLDPIAAAFLNLHDSILQLSDATTPLEKLVAATLTYSAAAQSVTSILSSIGQLQSALAEKRIEEIEGERDAALEAAGVAEATAVQTAESELTQAKATGDAKLIQEKENALKKAKINEEFDKKKRQAEYEAALQAWELQRMLAIVQASVTILNAISAGAKFGIAGMVGYGAVAAVAAGVQVAAIEAGKPTPPKFANGGIVPGSSYSGDNVEARVNSGELILNKAQQDSIAGQLSGFRQMPQISRDDFFNELFNASQDGRLIIADRAVRG